MQQQQVVQGSAVRQGAAIKPGASPGQAVLNLRGTVYVVVRKRLEAMLQDHPDWRLVTEIVHYDTDYVIVKAQVMDGDVVRATGHGSYPKADAPDFVERAETAAIGRALNHIGYDSETVARRIGNTSKSTKGGNEA